MKNQTQTTTARDWLEMDLAMQSGAIWEVQEEKPKKKKKKKNKKYKTSNNDNIKIRPEPVEYGDKKITNLPEDFIN